MTKQKDNPHTCPEQDVRIDQSVASLFFSCGVDWPTDNVLDRKQKLDMKSLLHYRAAELFRGASTQ